MASLFLQSLLIFNQQYLSWFFFIVTVVLGFFKTFKYKLPQTTLELELLQAVAVLILNQLRLFIAIKSNKTEKAHGCSVFFFIVFTVLCLLGFFFSILLQTYTVLLEFLVACVCVAFAVVEFFLTISQFIEFKSLEKAE